MSVFANIMANLMFFNMKTISRLQLVLKYERHEYNLYGLLHRKIFYVNNSSIRHSDELIDAEGTMYCKRYFNNNEKNKINCVELYENGKVIKTFKMIKYLRNITFNRVLKTTMWCLVMQDFRCTIN